MAALNEAERDQLARDDRARDAREPLAEFARQTAQFTPADVDLQARVVYLPIRHHSPACAWHVDRLIREIRPAAVLIEGPRDATPLVPLLVAPETRLPVAIYATYVRSRQESASERFAAYYPLCDFSPELVAVQAGLAVGADVEFIDLTFPEKIEAAHGGDEAWFDAPAVEFDSRPRSLQDETRFTHSRLLQAACLRTGARDPDDLWDHLYEVDYRARSTADFFRNVLAYCALARHDHRPESLAADGTLAREQAMADAIARRNVGQVVVVTGGFHTVALPATTPRAPRSLRLAPDDHQVVLMRYGFEQLDRLNGYASGMPSPEFYQRAWNRQSLDQLLVEIARECRRKNLGVSTSDAIGAVAQMHRLAALRGHAEPSREDLRDAARSLYIKGADDAEGVAVLAIARKLLAGARVGDVPPDAGQPPIVHDFRRQAAQLKLKLDKPDAVTVTLDLYRRTAHRALSRLFQRLTFLDVPLATLVRGPDFVAGVHLERIQEVWRYRWAPQTESTLIERSLYGSTIEEAATNLLLERFRAAEDVGRGGRAADATELILHACRMGLHRHAQELLARVGQLLAVDGAFDSLVVALENLLVLHTSREPLEAHRLSDLLDLAETAYRRACYLLPTLAATAAADEARQLEALNTFVQAVRTLGDSPDRQELRATGLGELLNSSAGSSVLRGGAAGILHADGRLEPELLVRHLHGHLQAASATGTEGPDFLRGLLKTARSVLWQIPECLACLQAALHAWDDERFTRMLPLLRLALSDLTPRETDQVARQVSTLLGVATFRPDYVADLPAAEMLRAVEVNRLVRESLIADGLEAWCD